MIYETTTFPYLHEIRRFRRNVEWFPSHLIGVGRLLIKVVINQKVGVLVGLKGLRVEDRSEH